MMAVTLRFIFAVYHVIILETHFQTIIRTMPIWRHVRRAQTVLAVHYLKAGSNFDYFTFLKLFIF